MSGKAIFGDHSPDRLVFNSDADVLAAVSIIGILCDRLGIGANHKALVGSSELLLYGHRTMERVNKTTLGDIDIVCQLPTNDDGFAAALVREREIGALLGWRRGVGNAYVTLWETKIGKVQIDFFPVSDIHKASWDIMMRSSPLGDLEEGIPGWAHKYLLRACTHRESFSILIYGKKGLTARYDSLEAISASGYRRKYSISSILTNNLCCTVNPKYYIKDIDTVSMLLFNAPAPMRSFKSVLQAVGTHYTGAQAGQVMVGLFDLLWGKRGQRLYETPEMDRKIKEHVFGFAQNALNIRIETLLSEPDRDKDEFYKKWHSSKQQTC